MKLIVVYLLVQGTSKSFTIPEYACPLHRRRDYYSPILLDDARRLNYSALSYEGAQCYISVRFFGLR